MLGGDDHVGHRLGVVGGYRFSSDDANRAFVEGTQVIKKPYQMRDIAGCLRSVLQEHGLA